MNVFKKIHFLFKEPIVEEPISIKKDHKNYETLEEGEVECSECKGIGYKTKINSGNHIGIWTNRCSKCHGSGKLDWIENVVGKHYDYQDSTGITNVSYTK